MDISTIIFQSEENKQFFLRHYRADNIPKNMECAFLGNYEQTDEFQVQMYQIISDYVNTYDTNFQTDNQKWLVFLGSNGAGKTHSACVIANELMARNYKVLYTDCSNMFFDIKQGYNTGENRVKHYASEKNEVLIIDEIGIIPLSENDYSNLFYVINERYKRELPTILITNFTDIGELGSALADRINEMAIKIRFPDKSYRGVIQKNRDFCIENIIDMD